MNIYSYANTMRYMLSTDFKIFKRTIIDKQIDLFIWISTYLVVTNFLMPAFGLEQSYTGFLTASLAASAGLFELWASVVNLVSDFEGNNITSFYLTLPIPSWLVFVKNLIFYTFNTAVLGILVLPISKLFLWSYLDFSHFSMLKFFIIFMLTNVFFAAFTLWTASRVPGMEKIGNVWMRFVYPLWWFGCFQYSFKVLHDFSPKFAYISLINPMVYAMEGTRAAVLGQEGSLNFWLCAGMLTVLTTACAAHAIIRLKKRLDFV